MDETAIQPGIKLSKLHIEDTVQFAIRHIPDVDRATLEKLVELVQTNGAFGSVSVEQFTEKICLILKYVPGACPDSLRILIELLEIEPGRSGILARFLAEQTNSPANQVESGSISTETRMATS